MKSEDIRAALYRASPHGRLAYMRERLDSGELRDEGARQDIEAQVGELQAMLDAGQVPAPIKFKLSLAHVERRYLQALRDGASHTLESAREAAERAKANQKAADLAKIERFFERAYSAGMGRDALQTAAVAVLKADEDKARESLQNMQSVDNKEGERRESARLAGLQKQLNLLTVHRAGTWLKARKSG